jgi:hypothetical protein
VPLPRTSVNPMITLRSNETTVNQILVFFITPYSKKESL